MRGKIDIQYVKDYCNDRGYELLTKEYTKAKDKIIMKDGNGYIVTATYDSFQRGYAPYPFSPSNQYTIQNIKHWLKINEPNYKLLSEKYIATHKKLQWQCPKGHIFEMPLSGFKDNGHRCPICKGIKNANRCKSNYSDVKAYIEGFDYKLITEKYSNTEQKLIMQCPQNHIFKIDLRHFKRGQRCPFCNGSSGEKEIQRVLDKRNIPYKREYTFPDLKDKFALRFDFAIFDNKGNLRELIEFDGSQHYKIKNFGGISLDEATQRFKEEKHHDYLKNKYCKDNNLKLIRIHYTQINDIEQVLDMAIPR